MKHPMQPLVKDDAGVIRFQQNQIVRDLLDFAAARGVGLNEIAGRGYSDEDQQQLAQLIGYSVSGFGSLSYASPQVVARADAAAAILVGSGGG